MHRTKVNGVNCFAFDQPFDSRPDFTALHARRKALMPSELIPADVQEFIRKRIDSIAQLEALLLLSGHAHITWTVPALARRLYISEPETKALLTHLESQGLFSAIPGEPVHYQYRPASAELDEVVKRVIENYMKHLVPVTNLVHSKTQTRIQEFADAFRLRKDK
jgi:hypothetical protein